MNVAITIWGNRISPVFDASQALLISAVNDGEIVDQKAIIFQAFRFDLVKKILRENDVQVLICGAICELGIERLEEMGIEIKPFITGKVDNVLRQFVNDEEIIDFAMPGCRVGGCCRRRSGKGSLKDEFTVSGNKK